MSDIYANSNSIKVGEGPDHVNIGAAGITFEGDARPVKVLRYGIQSLSGGGINPPSTGVIGSAAFFEFSQTTEEEVFVTGELSPEYAVGTPIIVEFLWSPSNTNTGSVVWAIDLDSVTPGDTIGGSPATFSATAPAPGVANELVKTILPVSTLSEDTINTIRIYRDATNPADTYNADAQLSLIIVKIITDQLGG